jgi:selenocysteine-specific elongation factor
VYVIATAGHVDHGKSTLVRALTGMEPDRWAEERRRGLTIGLGFCWTRLDGLGDVAFVDVPGHERFVPTMLGGVGPVPAVMFVVAADEGWMPQSTEHLAALDALGARHGLLVVTRADLADPAPATAEATAEIARTSLGTVPAVAVSAQTGTGVDEVRAAVRTLAGSLPEPDRDAPVRLWVDRSFSMRGAGTVVTGTLPAGTIRRGDRLAVAGAGRDVVVRGIESLGRPTDEATAVARVALNLRGADPSDVPRGTALTTPGRWAETTVVDVRLRPPVPDPLPRGLIAHVGPAAVAARVRPLGADTARLGLDAAIPAHIGDRMLLRDPGSRRVVGVRVLDPSPPSLRRRGSARRRAAELDTMSGEPDGAAELSRRGIIRAGTLTGLGADVPAEPLVGDWLVDADRAASLQQRLVDLVEDHRRRHPLDAGLPLESARRRLGLPDLAIVQALAARAGGRVSVREGRLVTADAAVPDELSRAVAPLLRQLSANPFDAPEADTLADMGLGPKEIAAAVRAGLVLRIADRVVVGTDAPDRALAILTGLSQPFTLSEARRTLGTTRRVAVPLLEWLQRSGRTRRVGDRHEIVG